jgi:hypothetical protein
MASCVCTKSHPLAANYPWAAGAGVASARDRAPGNRPRAIAAREGRQRRLLRWSGLTQLLPGTGLSRDWPQRPPVVTYGSPPPLPALRVPDTLAWLCWADSDSVQEDGISDSLG